MRRLQGSLIFCILVTTACIALFPSHAPPPTQTQSPTASPAPTLPPPPPTVTLTPTPIIPTETPPAITADDIAIHFHPDGDLFVNDLVSIEVIAPEGMDLSESTVSIDITQPFSNTIDTGRFSSFGIGGRQQATFYWVWDTGKNYPGEQTISFSIQPENLGWTQTLTLLPSEELPGNEIGAQWQVAESDCCLVYSISNTAGARDLEEILETADLQAEDVSSHFGVPFEEPIVVNLIPRVLGHGGFAGGEILVSYLDRNYAGSTIANVLRHEMVHILDSTLGGDLRPSVFIEGLAVYFTGGHFKPEPLLPRAAALLPPSVNEYGLNWYIPFDELIENFYFVHHEIGYLEAAALVEFMVETWGWEKFSTFYRDIHPADDGSLASAVDQALNLHYEFSLEELERLYIEHLSSLGTTQALAEDVRLCVTFYKTVRRYQQALDHSAYFLTAWIPPIKVSRNKSIVTDFMRRPDLPENITLEVMLIDAEDAFLSKDYNEIEHILESVNQVLDAFDDGSERPFETNDLARSYYQIISLVLENGLYPNQVDMGEDKAIVMVSDNQVNLSNITVTLESGTWTFSR